MQIPGGLHVSRFLQLQAKKQQAKENFNAFGKLVSVPQGYQAAAVALIPSVSLSDYIRAAMRGSSDFQNLGIAVVVTLGAILQGEGTLQPDAEVGKTLGASLQGTGSFSGDARMVAMLSASIDAGARPSAFDIAQEVWQGSKAAYNTPGTMGNAVNSAGSAGDPWSTDLDSGSYPAGSAGYYLKQMSAEELANAIMTDPRFLTVAKFLGLK